MKTELLLPETDGLRGVEGSITFGLLSFQNNFTFTPLQFTLSDKESDILITHADDSLGVGRVFGCVCVCVCVCLSVCIVEKKTTGGIDLKLDLMLVHADPKTPINFGGQRSKVKVTGSKKVNILLLPL